MGGATQPAKEIGYDLLWEGNKQQGDTIDLQYPLYNYRFICVYNGNSSNAYNQGGLIACTIGYVIGDDLCCYKNFCNFPTDIFQIHSALFTINSDSQLLIESCGYITLNTSTKAFTGVAGNNHIYKIYGIK